MESPIITILVALAGCGGLWSLINAIIHRKWDTEDNIKKILNGIDELKEHTDDSLTDLEASLKSQIKEVDDRLTKHIEEEQEQAALQARSRILRGANDLRLTGHIDAELLENLQDDITFYNDYCKANPKFKNNKSKLSIELLEEAFKKLPPAEV